MRGLLIGVLVLAGLDVVLASPASRVATLLNRPASWLSAWMDPSRPLIPEGHLSGGGGAAPRPAGTGGKSPQPAPGTGPGGILPLVTGLLP